MTRTKLPRGQVYLDSVSVLRHSALQLSRPLSQGPITAQFERDFANYIGARHAIALPRARVALQLILESLDLPKGSEVLLTPITIPDIVNAIAAAGHKPVFVDLGKLTGNIDSAWIEWNVSSRTKVLLVTHLCGMPSDMERLCEVARAHDLILLEDCSQAMGARYRGRVLGLFGRAAFFSLTTLKPLSTFHGGMTITDDAQLADKLRARHAAMPPPDRRRFASMLARDHVMHAAMSPPLFSTMTWPVLSAAERWRPEWAAQFQRGNVTLSREKSVSVIRRDRLPDDMFVQYSDYQAAIGLDSLRLVDDGNRRRRALSLHLLRLLAERGIPGLLKMPDDGESTFWRFPLWVKERERFRVFLRARGIDSGATNLPCLSREPAFVEFGRSLPQAEDFIDHAIFLPMHPTMTEADMERVASAAGGYFSEGGS